MPACQVCGVAMTTSEVTNRPYDGVAGNWHNQCAYIDYLCSSPLSAAQQDEGWSSTLFCFRYHLENKRAGIATDFP